MSVSVHPARIGGVVDWLAFLVSTALALGLIAFSGYKFARFMDRLFPIYRIIPAEVSAWGTLYEIVDQNGNSFGVDRYTVAMQRCTAMNRQAGNRLTKPEARPN